MTPERWSQMREVALWTTQPLTLPSTAEGVKAIRQLGALLREALEAITPESEGSS